MFRLFKEAFKSLSKNKVVIIGLTILVFLTSTIFTLLFNLRSSFNNQLEDYKKVSKIQDLTVDLNLPTNGNAYNGGYFINGNSKKDADKYKTGNRKWDDPIPYVLKDDWDKKPSFDLKLYDDPSQKSIDYIKLSDIDATYTGDLYIDKNDLAYLYNIYKIDKNLNKKARVTFDLKEANSSFSISNDPELSKLVNPIFLYEKTIDSSGKSVFKKHKNNSTLNNDTTLFNLDAKYTNMDNVAKLFTVFNSSDKNDIYFKDINSLYINLKTLEITFDYFKANDWINYGYGIKLSEESTAKLVGLTPDSKYTNLYKIDTITNPDALFNIKIVQVDSKDTVEYSLINNTISLSKLLKYAHSDFNTWATNIVFNSDSTTFKIDDVNLDLFKKGTNYNVPNDFVFKQIELTQYFKNHYDTTFINDIYDSSAPVKPGEKPMTYIDMWNGSFRTFMSKLMNDTDKQLENKFNTTFEELSKLSYWYKTSTVIYWRADSNAFDLKTNIFDWKDKVKSNGVLFKETKNIIEPKDLGIGVTSAPILYEFNNKFNGFVENSGSLVERTIEEVELEYHPNWKSKTKKELLNLIGDRTIKTRAFNTISKGAEYINSSKVIDIVRNKVGENSIGYRQTITVDGFNEKTKEKNVFHFINTGDSNNEIDGVKLNVGKLYNEHYLKTQLNSVTNSKSEFYKTNQIPPYVATKILNLIYGNLNPAVEYFNTDIRFNKVIIRDYDLDEETTINNKIVVLSPYILSKSGINESSPLANNTLFNDDKNEFAITNYKNKFILLKRDVKTIPGSSDKNYSNWISVNPKEFSDQALIKTNNRMNDVELTYLFNSTNHYTLHYKGTIGPNGWAKVDETYNNFIYIPIVFRAPATELVTEALSKGTVDYMMSKVEETLLSLDLIKNGFIDVDFIAKLVPIAKKILAEQNFGTVFAQGKMNNSIIAPILINLFYEMTQDNPDTITNLFTNFFQQVKKQIVNRPDAREYFELQYSNLKILFKQAFDIDVLDKIGASVIFDITKDANVSLDAISDIISSINFKLFFEKMHDFYTLKNEFGAPVYNGYVNKNGYERKLSTVDLMSNLFQSIDALKLKHGLIKFIETIDFNRVFDKENSVLSTILQSNSPIWGIIEKLNSNQDKTKPELNYSNVSNGLIELIKILDVKELLKQFISAIKVNEQDIWYAPNIVNGVEAESINHKVLLSDISLQEIINILFNSLFKNNANASLIKDSVIKMLNLSSNTVDKFGKGFFIPGPDDKRLGLFELLGLSSLPKAESSNDFAIAQDILNKLSNIQKDTTEFSIFNKKELEFIKYYFSELTIKNNVETEKITDEVTNFVNMKNMLVGENSIVSYADRIMLETPNVEGIDEVIKSIVGIFLTSADDEFGKITQTSQLYTFLVNIMAGIDNVNDAKHVAQKIVRFVYDSRNEPDSLFNLLAKQKLEPEFPNIDVSGIPKTTNGLVNYRLIANDYLKNKNNKFFEYVNGDPILKKHLIDTKYKDVLGNEISWIELNKYKLFYYWALLVSSDLNTVDNYITKVGAFEQFSIKFIDKVTQTDNFKYIKLLKLMTNKYTQMAQIIWNFNIPPILINPYMFPISNGTALWFITNTNKINDKFSEKGNIAFIIKNKIADFDALVNDSSWMQQLISSLLLTKNELNSSIGSLVDYDQSNNLVIDNSYFEHLNELNQKHKLSVFGINLIDLIYNAINSITFQKVETNAINFNDVGSYVAKVNYSYLIANKKEIYKPSENWTIPSDPTEIQYLLDNIDEKYLLDVNGSKFLIIGEETTVDYLYPVVDENNLQVNTRNQAIVYVNKKGFDRMANAYQGNVIKKYLLVQNSTKLSDTELRNVIEKEIKATTGPSDILQRTMLRDEVDPVNPERSIRISMPLQVISLLGTAIVGIISALIILVSVSIIFIIRRYISNKAKVIGILISQGYTKLEIAVSLIVFAAVASFIGATLGYIIGSQSQIYLMDIFSNYWTLPKEVISFNAFTLFFTVFVPFVGISILIIVVSMFMLRTKPLELMQGTNDVRFKTLQVKMSKFDKMNVKHKFTSSLILNSLGKLTAFSFSILLTSVVTAFGIASIGKFAAITTETYKNRDFKFKIDMETPTIQGGTYQSYNPNNLSKEIYTPNGQSGEVLTGTYNYFRPGFSSAINSSNIANPNGNVGISDRDVPHIITQFSVNIAVDAGVSVDPWQIAYNSMPDTQKAKVNAARNPVGYQLQNTQKSIRYRLVDQILDELKINLSEMDTPVNQKRFNDRLFVHLRDKMIQAKSSYANASQQKIEEDMKLMFEDYSIYSYINQFGVYAVNDKNEPIDFFLYVNKDGENGFVYEKAKPSAKKPSDTEYTTQVISTSLYRTEYRQFIINGYKAMQTKEFAQYIPIKITKVIPDYFISFGGVLFDPVNDEKYTYLDASLNNKNIKIYGYQNKVKEHINGESFVRLKGNLKQDLAHESESVLALSGDYKDKIYPVVINEVVSRGMQLKTGDIIEVKVKNTTDRYTKKLKSIKNKNHSNSMENIENIFKFKVIGINNTYINNEFITTYEIANKLTGLDELFAKQGNHAPFNGIMTQSDAPTQVTGSSSLYSVSGYWPALNNFDIEALSTDTQRQVFDNIFGTEDQVKDVNGVSTVIKGTWSSENESNLFRDLGWTKEQVVKNFLGEFGTNLTSVREENFAPAITKFSSIFDGKLYIPLATSIDSKDIEAGFTLNIADTVESLLVSMIVLSFIISIIILVIVSTILINENEKNIAIFSILGYSGKERVKTFFAIFVPFITISVLISVGITTALIHGFSNMVLSSSSIYLPIALTWWPIFLTIVVIMITFIITTTLAWITINKMKAIDLLKGK